MPDRKESFHPQTGETPVSNIIQFLEAMGSQQLTASEYAATVAALELDPQQRQALLDRDHAALNDLLGGRAKMFFGILAPNEEPLRREDEEPVEDQPDEPKESVKLS
jgi:hypothetical protein